jgi:hypothetical protein
MKQSAIILHVPTIAIVVPVFSINTTFGARISDYREGAISQIVPSDASNSSLIGYWVGVLDLQSIDDTMKKLVLEK